MYISWLIHHSGSILMAEFQTPVLRDLKCGSQTFFALVASSSFTLRILRKREGNFSSDHGISILFLNASFCSYFVTHCQSLTNSFVLAYFSVTLNRL